MTTEAKKRRRYVIPGKKTLKVQLFLVKHERPKQFMRKRFLIQYFPAAKFRGVGIRIFTLFIFYVNNKIVLWYLHELIWKYTDLYQF